jgi:hypothetical protein
MLLGTLLIALEWLKVMQGEKVHPAMTIWLVIAALCGIATAAIGLTRPFNNAEAAARFVMARADNAWVSFPDSRGEGITGLTGIPFERLPDRCLQSVVRWNLKLRLKSGREIYHVLAARARSGGYYVLSDTRMEFPHVRAIGHVPAGYDGQEFWFYEVGNAGAGARPRLPDCAKLESR